MKSKEKVLVKTQGIGNNNECEPQQERGTSMKRKLLTLLSVVSLSFFISAALAQENKEEECKDHKVLKEEESCCCKTLKEGEAGFEKNKIVIVCKPLTVKTEGNKCIIPKEDTKNAGFTDKHDPPEEKDKDGKPLPKKCPCKISIEFQE